MHRPYVQHMWSGCCDEKVPPHKSECATYKCCFWLTYTHILLAGQYKTDRSDSAQLYESSENLRKRSIGCHVSHIGATWILSQILWYFVRLRMCVYIFLMQKHQTSITTTETTDKSLHAFWPMTMNNFRALCLIITHRNTSIKSAKNVIKVYVSR